MFKGVCGSCSDFYFIGIGGVSMSALAKLMLAWKKRVCGSDNCESVYVKELRKLGAEVDTGALKRSVAEFDVIVYTDAIFENDPQLSEARRLGKTVLSRGQFLNEVSKNFSNVIAVAGCHGKTTCTCMLAHIFKAAGKKFCAHIGGRDLSFSNFYIDGMDYFITEACEYKKNFLYLKPNVAVVLNMGADHMECYGSEDELVKCYRKFSRTAEVKINPYGDNPTDGLTFGFDKDASYSARRITQVGGKYSFYAYEGEAELGKITLNVYGKHNILNALAAIAAARSEEIRFGSIKLGLSEFKGVERRFEKLGEVNGAEVMADYAHHPDEIGATIRTAKRITRGNLYVIFQPHTYSRTRLLLKQFIKVLSPLQNLLIYKTFAAREYYDDAGSALTLSQKIKKSRYGDDKRDITDFISTAGAGDLVLFLGAGDIYEIAKDILKTQRECL